MRSRASIHEAIDGSIDGVCMNPRATSCDVCIFNTRIYTSPKHLGQPWCKAEEREAKQLYDIQRSMKHAS